MKLDFFTLYVVIVALSVSLAVIWGALAWQYRGFEPARTWFFAALTSAIGGLLLPFQHGIHGPFVAAAGNGLIIFAFWLFARGLHQLHGEKPRITVPAVVSATCAGLTVAMFSHGEAIALLYAFGQSTPMVLMLLFLAVPQHRSAGGAISFGGLSIGLLGHGTVVAMNIANLTSPGADPDWSGLAALTMLGVIFSGLLLNFGFAVLTIDRLREELAKLANTDALTGALNRHGLDAWLATGAPRSAPFHGVLLIDLNNFKQINDRYGHKAGDECLAHFARIAKSQLRKADLLVRLGGDEFCVLLPAAGGKESKEIAGKIRMTLADSPLLWNRQRLRLSCSIGTAVWQSNIGTSLDDVLIMADADMYARKSLLPVRESVFLPQTEREVAQPIL